MSDGTIYINRLPVTCVIGVHPHERSSQQQLLISITLDLDVSSAAADDSLEQTLDYVAVADTVERIATEGRFQLVETLAERIADALLMPPVSGVGVDVQKPSALPATREVGVRIRRERPV